MKSTFNCCTGGELCSRKKLILQQGKAQFQWQESQLPAETKELKKLHFGFEQGNK
jgi:hypothetical protein